MRSGSCRLIGALVGVLSCAVGGTTVAAAQPAPVRWTELRVPADSSIEAGAVMNSRGDIAAATLDVDDTVEFQWRSTPLLWTGDNRGPTPTGPRLPLFDQAFVPTDVNEGGVVALGSAASDGYLWHAGRRTELSNPDWIAYPYAVDDSGQAVGQLFTALDPDAPEVPARAFRWRDGRFTELPAPAGWSSRAIDINNRGTVLGELRSGERVRAVVWHDGVLTELGGWQTTPVDLNDEGQVIGVGAAREGDPMRPFLWRDGVMTDLLAGSGADTGWASAINNEGQVVGSVDSQPAVWRDGKLIRIPIPGGQGEATSINERGEVAGVTWDTPERTDGQVFTWYDGRTTVLGRPADAAGESGGAGPEIVGIDERGRVAIRYQRADGRWELARTDPT